VASTAERPDPAGPGRRWTDALSRRVWLVVALVAALALGGGGLAGRWVAGHPGTPAGTDSRVGAATSQSTPVSGQATPVSGLPTVPVAELPPQARTVLATIDAHGTFRYSQDGTVFGNFEGLLPARPAGYYHEFTVPTPGSPDRGARRLVVGDGGDVYYTDDHYQSFRQVLR
jgi:ribonuclease T1